MRNSSSSRASAAALAAVAASPSARLAPAAASRVVASFTDADTCASASPPTGAASPPADSMLEATSATLSGDTSAPAIRSATSGAASSKLAAPGCATEGTPSSNSATDGADSSSGGGTTGAAGGASGATSVTAGAAAVSVCEGRVGVSDTSSKLASKSAPAGFVARAGNSSRPANRSSSDAAGFAAVGLATAPSSLSTSSNTDDGGATAAERSPHLVLDENRSEAPSSVANAPPSAHDVSSGSGTAGVAVSTTGDDGKLVTGPTRFGRAPVARSPPAPPLAASPPPTTPPLLASAAPRPFECGDADGLSFLGVMRAGAAAPTTGLAPPTKLPAPAPSGSSAPAASSSELQRAACQSSSPHTAMRLRKASSSSLAMRAQRRQYCHCSRCGMLPASKPYMRPDLVTTSNLPMRPGFTDPMSAMRMRPAMAPGSPVSPRK
mmetsp:Transcript_11930/g.41862  ORF Transcript_11930/g.41862 Transcript_11930/m.41862 type:complete len:437 (+) Transcript_11930:1079-2389(+)